MKKYITFFIYILIPICVGALSGIMSRSAMTDYKLLQKPLFSPPGALFPIVWTILYILMGTSAYIIYSNQNSSLYQTMGLVLYYVQLFMNFIWSLIFFNGKQYLGALIWLLIMWAVIILMLICFKKVSKLAFLLCIPLFLWTTFAAYLNIGFAYLNS